MKPNDLAQGLNGWVRSFASLLLLSNISQPNFWLLWRRNQQLNYPVPCGCNKVYHPRCRTQSCPTQRFTIGVRPIQCPFELDKHALCRCDCALLLGHWNSSEKQWQTRHLSMSAKAIYFTGSNTSLDGDLVSHVPRLKVECVSIFFEYIPFPKQNFGSQWVRCPSPCFHPGCDGHHRHLPPHHPPTRTKTSSHSDSTRKYCLRRRPYLAFGLRRAPPSLRRWTHPGDEARWAAIPAGSAHRRYSRGRLGWRPVFWDSLGPIVSGGGRGGVGGCGTSRIVDFFSISGGAGDVALAKIVDTCWNVAVTAVSAYRICALRIFRLCLSETCCGLISCFQAYAWTSDYWYPGLFIPWQFFTHTQVTVCPVAHMNMFKRGERLKRKKRGPIQQVFEGKIGVG